MLLNNPKDLNLLCWYERNVHMHCVPSVTSYGILFSHRSIRMKRNHVPFALHDSIHIWNNKIVLHDDSSMNVPKNVHHLDTFNSHDFISRKINCQHNSWKFRSNFLCTFFWTLCCYFIHFDCKKKVFTTDAIHLVNFIDSKKR